MASSQKAGGEPREQLSFDSVDALSAAIDKKRSITGRAAQACLSIRRMETMTVAGEESSGTVALQITHTEIKAICLVATTDTKSSQGTWESMRRGGMFLAARPMPLVTVPSGHDVTKPYDLMASCQSFNGWATALMSSLSDGAKIIVPFPQIRVMSQAAATGKPAKRNRSFMGPVVIGDRTIEKPLTRNLPATLNQGGRIAAIAANRPGTPVHVNSLSALVSFHAFGKLYANTPVTLHGSCFFFQDSSIGKKARKDSVLTAKGAELDKLGFWKFSEQDLQLLQPATTRRGTVHVSMQAIMQASL
jgi:hypothetical protein